MMGLEWGEPLKAASLALGLLRSVPALQIFLHCTKIKAERTHYLSS